MIDRAHVTKTAGRYLAELPDGQKIESDDIQSLAERIGALPDVRFDDTNFGDWKRGLSALERYDVIVFLREMTRSDKARKLHAIRKKPAPAQQTPTQRKSLPQPSNPEVTTQERTTARKIVALRLSEWPTQALAATEHAIKEALTEQRRQRWAFDKEQAVREQSMEEARAGELETQKVALQKMPAGASTTQATAPQKECTTKVSPEKMHPKDSDAVCDNPAEFFAPVVLSHPAIEGLSLTAEQRRYVERLQYLVDGEQRIETVAEVLARMRWKAKTPAGNTAA